MNMTVKREIKALRRIREQCMTMGRVGYIEAYFARKDGELLFLMQLDRYQQCRDFYNMPDVTARGRDDWDVDEWSAAKHIIFWGRVTSRTQYRHILVAAKNIEARYRGHLLRNALSVQRALTQLGCVHWDAAGQPWM
ncbi:hypothetical protein [Serratia liquefaciens]|uniref:hypothetical protein n=1 Tax=Serratia liquefaciens TaxID=614 RepID=UPI00390602D5